eukprot:8121455-Pyramimonas_sp.AAC.1
MVHPAQPERHGISNGVAAAHRATSPGAVERANAADAHRAATRRAGLRHRANGRRQSVLARALGLQQRQMHAP